MFAILIITATVLVCWDVVVGKKPKRPPGSRPLPGPWGEYLSLRNSHTHANQPGLPLIGRVHDVPSEASWLKFHEWAKKYGPIYQTEIFGTVHVWISDEKIAHQLLAKRARIYSDRPLIPNLPNNRTSGEYLALLGRNEMWLRQRKLCNHLMHISTLADLHMYPTRERDRFLWLFYRDPQNYVEWIEQFTSRTVSRLCWGTARPAQVLRHTTFGLLQTISPSGALPNVVSVLRFVPSSISPWKRRERARHLLEKKLFKANVEYVRKKGNGQPCFYETFLTSKTMGTEKQRERQADDAEAMHVVGLMAIAGALTIGSPIQSYLLAMCHYPEWQARLQLEIDTVLEGRCPQWADRPRLPVLRAVVKEIIRWRPPVPTGIPHQLEEDDVWEGYHIPRGATIHALEWGITRDEKVYPNPEQFNPARWLDPSYPTYRDPLSKYPNLQGYSQFGFGRRTCQGIPIVEQDLFLIMGGMAWAFEIRKKRDLATGEEIDVHWNDYTPLLIAKPKKFLFEALPRSREKVRKMFRMFQRAKGLNDQDDMDLSEFEEELGMKIYFDEEVEGGGPTAPENVRTTKRVPLEIVYDDDGEETDSESVTPTPTPESSSASDESDGLNPDRLDSDITPFDFTLTEDSELERHEQEKSLRERVFKSIPISDRIKSPRETLRELIPGFELPPEPLVPKDLMIFTVTVDFSLRITVPNGENQDNREYNDNLEQQESDTAGLSSQPTSAPTAEASTSTSHPTFEKMSNGVVVTVRPVSSDHHTDDEGLTPESIMYSPIFEDCEEPQGTPLTASIQEEIVLTGPKGLKVEKMSPNPDWPESKLPMSSFDEMVEGVSYDGREDFDEEEEEGLPWPENKLFSQGYDTDFTGELGEFEAWEKMWSSMKWKESQSKEKDDSPYLPHSPRHPNAVFANSDDETLDYVPAVPSIGGASVEDEEDDNVPAIPHIFLGNPIYNDEDTEDSDSSFNAEFFTPPEYPSSVESEGDESYEWPGRSSSEVAEFALSDDPEFDPSHLEPGELVVSGDEGYDGSSEMEETGPVSDPDIENEHDHDNEADDAVSQASTGSVWFEPDFPSLLFPVFSPIGWTDLEEAVAKQGIEEREEENEELVERTAEAEVAQEEEHGRLSWWRRPLPGFVNRFVPRCVDRFVPDVPGYYEWLIDEPIDRLLQERIESLEQEVLELPKRFMPDVIWEIVADRLPQPNIHPSIPVTQSQAKHEALTELVGTRPDVPARLPVPDHFLPEGVTQLVIDHLPTMPSMPHLPDVLLPSMPSVPQMPFVSKAVTQVVDHLPSIPNIPRPNMPSMPSVPLKPYMSVPHAVNRFVPRMPEAMSLFLPARLRFEQGQQTQPQEQAEELGHGYAEDMIRV